MKLIIYVLILVSLFLSSCLGERLQIFKSQYMAVESDKIKRIVSIAPRFVKIDTRGKLEDFYLESDKEGQKFEKYLVENAKKCGLDLQVFSRNTISNQDVDYFNDLLALQREISNAFDNYVPDFTSLQKSLFKVPVRIMYNVPLISSRFSHLSKKYNTPYFAFHFVGSYITKRKGKLFMLLVNPPMGVLYSFKPDVLTFYYTAIVNIESGELVYSEERQTTDLPEVSSLNAFIYDSFRILKSK